MASLSLSLVEIIVLMLGAVTLGITIHFFIVSRRNIKASSPADHQKLIKERDDWMLRYFNDVEVRDKQLATLRTQLDEATENSNIYSMELSEMKKVNKRLLSEKDAAKETIISSVPAADRPAYIDQLREAQSSLLEHNEKINQLLGQIDIVKETEEKQQEIMRDNQELSSQLSELRQVLTQKEKEIDSIRQKEHLTKEMNSMLDNAYNEFHVLQDKIQKLEGQVSASRMINIEYEDLKESYQKVSRDFEEQRLKYTATSTENIHLRDRLAETEEKLREANFQRQQLQKRVAYLEELNNDMQAVADTNKKLEGQLKRIGELESMLNVLSEERDELAKKQLG